MRDTQRSKVYAWENLEFNSHRGCKPGVEPELTIRQCQAIVRTVAKHFKCAMPDVTDGRGRRRACFMPAYYAGEKNSIRLPRWSRVKEVVLHEAAHMVINRYFTDRVAADHGREFLGVYMYLLKRYAKTDTKVMGESARAHGLDYVSIESSTPRTIGGNK
jgi:hypothetical protein